MPYIGIDLGTTNSLVCVFEDGKPVLVKNALGKFLTPSVVHIDGDIVVCGDVAQSKLVTSPERTASVFKRTMGAEKTYKLGRKKFTAEELSAIVLSSLKRDAEAYLQVPITDVVVSVPAYFNEFQRKAVKSACQIAGMNLLRLINEPTAAALAYGLHDIAQESTFLVFDLGGGTFDVSILEVFEGVMEVKSSAGDAFLGGEDFTSVLVEHFVKDLGLKKLTYEEKGALRRNVEIIKHELSSRHQVSLKAQVSGKEVTLEISRGRFEELSSELTRRLHRPVERAIYDAKLRVEDIDRVVLVGGATRMPLIRSYISKLLKKLPEIGLDPDQVVALGAGIQAGLVGKDAALDDVVMTDVSAFTLGIETQKSGYGANHIGYYAPIIERNSVVPISREEIFHTAQLGQRNIEVRVYQGEAARVEGNIFLASLKIKVPRNFQQHESIAVRFSYDISGLLEVDVKVLSTGEQHNLLITELSGELSDNEIRTKLSALNKLKIHPRDQQENMAVQARIEQCYAMARFEDREHLQEMLVSFEDTLARQDPTDITLLRERITEELDRFESGYVQF
jgi:molecular chaperone HscC